MNPAPFEKAEEWDELDKWDAGIQIETVTASLCLAEGLPANSSDHFFMACHPDSGRVRTLRFFPARHILPILATFDLAIIRTSDLISVQFQEVGRDKAAPFETLFRSDPPEGKLEDLLAGAWQRLETYYPALLDWRRAL
jgi:hypothetical protein